MTKEPKELKELTEWEERADLEAEESRMKPEVLDPKED